MRVFGGRKGKEENDVNIISKNKIILKRGNPHRVA